jgi:hypothetical protein
VTVRMLYLVFVRLAGWTVLLVTDLAAAPQDPRRAEQRV